MLRSLYFWNRVSGSGWRDSGCSDEDKAHGNQAFHESSKNRQASTAALQWQQQAVVFNPVYSNAYLSGHSSYITGAALHDVGCP